MNQWSTGYLSNNDHRIHIGLGQQKLISKLEVTWPDGKQEAYKNIESDRYLTILKGKGIQTK